jgi:radical SAM superfamily enzyme YgiQ (UPF0313 family)
MKALLVQPPFAQLNSPYPAVHYLESFLRSRGVEVSARDHSIELYRALFSRDGLAPAFDGARRLLGEDTPREDTRGEWPDEATVSQLERYLSYEDLYLEWVEGLTAFLSGGDPAFAHRLSQAVELPRGMRSEAFLEARGGRIASHEARGLATALLEDLGDLVTYAYDPSFGTVRYGERIDSSAKSFAAVRSALGASPLLELAYSRLLAAEWRAAAPRPELLLVSIPFPGCLLGALACARSAREAFGSGLRVLFGGGYVSTELRGLRDGGIFDFCDYLCFDSGYGSIDSILEVEAGAPKERLYKSMYRDSDGRLVASGFEAGDEASSEPEIRRLTRCDEASRIGRDEASALVSVAPDYRSADFDRYLQVVDSDNPMHRLWSDSPWLKYGLARGCYWRRCSFCDTSLEYVSLFAPADIAQIMSAAGTAAERTGLYGLHFVDEAMPMSSLLAFARANAARSRSSRTPFHFWGNARFDSSWTEDRCEYLAASGLVAVSGGIEIATEGGLEMTDKGFDLEGLARTLVAMRRAGLLVHAYLIYGFPGQSRQDVLDSAEACRQLFAAGLVDSAFWHRFVLTRHSRMYAQWREGLRPALAPLDEPWDFANNDLAFEGDRAFDEFDGPLAASLEAWMAGEELDVPVPGGRLERGLVEGLVERAEADLDAARYSREGRAHWIAGAPAARPLDRRRSRLAWSYRGEAREIVLPREAASVAARELQALARDAEGRPFAELAGILEAQLGPSGKPIEELRRSGLVVV